MFLTEKNMIDNSDGNATDVEVDDFDFRNYVAA